MHVNATVEGMREDEDEDTDMALDRELGTNERPDEEMSEDGVLGYVCSLPHVIAWRPQQGTDPATPPIAWGDSFFYYSPAGLLPSSGQPFATITTKDYRDEPACGLGHPGAFRVTIHVGAHAYQQQCGHHPRQAPAPQDVAALDHRQSDVLLPHPAYARLGWLCVRNPAQRTAATTRNLLVLAHRLAGERHQRHVLHQRHVRGSEEPPATGGGGAIALAPPTCCALRASRPTDHAAVSA